MRRTATLALSTGLLLAGCIGPRPERPADSMVVAPPAWRTTLGPGSPIATEWWQAFGDPQLTALVTTALANSPDLGSAAARVEEARAQERLARAQLSPNVTAGLPVSEARTVTALGTGLDALGTQPLVQASYDFDLFGRLRSARAAASRRPTAAHGDTGEAVGELELRVVGDGGHLTTALWRPRADALRDAAVAVELVQLQLARP